MTEIEKYEGGQIVTRRDLRNASTDSWTEVLEEIGDLAGRIAGTDFVPDSFRNSVPAVAATILTGRELGFAPMMALSSLHSIKGKVGLSAEAMRALVLQAGHEIITTSSSSEKCTMKGRRAGSEEWTEVTWTMGDARQAGLLNGSGWKNYPRQMLQARTSAELCRLAFPDVIRGLASIEEIVDYDVVPGTVAAVVADEADKPAPVKRAARKRAVAPKAEPAEAPALPEDEAATSEEAAPPPDLPEPTASPAAPTDERDDDEAKTPDAGDATEGQGPGEAPAGDAVPPPDDEDEGIVDAEVVEELDAGSMPVTTSQTQTMVIHFGRLGLSERAQRLNVVQHLIGREVESSKDLTFQEATGILHVLETCKDRQALDDVLKASGA